MQQHPGAQNIKTGSAIILIIAGIAHFYIPLAQNFIKHSHRCRNSYR